MMPPAATSAREILTGLHAVMASRGRAQSKLDKVVEMIRGKKDTVVRLQVIPVSATDPSVRKIVEIRRDEIKLKEQEAKAEIVERTLPDGTTQRLGWIVLPSFYADMDRSGAAADSRSDTRERSTTTAIRGVSSVRRRA